MARIDTMELSSQDVAGAATRIISRWRDRRGLIWLDSACGEARLGRFSILAVDPCATLRVCGDEVRYKTAQGEQQWRAHPWDALAEIAGQIVTQSLPDGFPAPFAGGLVGYIAYDVGAAVPTRPLGVGQDLSLPDLAFGVYDTFVCIDHRDNRLHVVSSELPLTGRAAAPRTDEHFDGLREDVIRALAADPVPDLSLHTAPPSTARWRHADGAAAAQLQSTFTRQAYVQQVRRVLDLINAGAVEQVNLAQRFSMPTKASVADLYDCLRRESPAPFAALLDVGDAWILSSSPERLLRIGDDRIEMRPIKGTRPRGRAVAQDAWLRADLLDSAKDAAEHDMIVQLELEQLKRLCVPGSVHVPEPMVCEEYKTVFHLVSTVSGRLAPGMDRLECVRALFPGGSITGRPKERALELIDELEPVSRGVYTGAIGYFGVGGNIDLNVAIRTIVLQDGQAHFHVGGAVVAGSDPEDEYEETLDKAEGIVRALLASAP